MLILNFLLLNPIFHDFEYLDKVGSQDAYNILHERL